MSNVIHNFRYIFRGILFSPISKSLLFGSVMGATSFSAVLFSLRMFCITKWNESGGGSGVEALAFFMLPLSLSVGLGGFVIGTSFRYLSLVKFGQPSLVKLVQPVIKKIVVKKNL